MYNEDTEDVYIFRFLITGLLLFGVSGYLEYRQIRKTSAAVVATVKLCDGTGRSVNVQTETLSELNCKLDAFLEQNRRLPVELTDRMDKDLEKLERSARRELTAKFRLFGIHPLRYSQRDS